MCPSSCTPASYHDFIVSRNLDPVEHCSLLSFLAFLCSLFYSFSKYDNKQDVHWALGGAESMMSKTGNVFAHRSDMFQPLQTAPTLLVIHQLPEIPSPLAEPQLVSYFTSSRIPSRISTCCIRCSSLEFPRRLLHQAGSWQETSGILSEGTWGGLDKRTIYKWYQG